MTHRDHFQGAYAQLTAKQREAVNLLIQHKTSKEISKLLGVSPHTVDQRIEAAKRKFGVASRGELAQAFRSCLPMGEQLTYEDSHMSDLALPEDSSVSDEPDNLDGPHDPKWFGQYEQAQTLESYHVLPELFSGPTGALYRLLAIVAIAMLLVVTVLAGISIYVAMTEILKQ